MLYIRFISLVTKAGATRRGLFLLLFFSLFSPSLSFYFLFFRPERKNWKREKTKRPNKIPTMCSRKKKNWTIHLYNLVFHGLIYISLKRQKGTSLSLSLSLSFPSLTVSFILALFFSSSSVYVLSPCLFVSPPLLATGPALQTSGIRQFRSVLSLACIGPKKPPPLLISNILFNFLKLIDWHFWSRFFFLGYFNHYTCSIRWHLRARFHFIHSANSFRP